MQTCFTCGSAVPGGGARRMLFGGFGARQILGRRVLLPLRTERTVCPPCTAKLDRQLLLRRVVYVIAGVLLAGALISDKLHTDAITAADDKIIAAALARTDPDSAPGLAYAPAWQNPVAADTPAATQPAKPPEPFRQWQNTSSHGTRWSLDQDNATRMQLHIDLGGDQNALVYVNPAFARLDRPSMDYRVDLVRERIIRRFARRSATYVYSRSGAVTALP